MTRNHINKGILIIAHGSRNKKWINYIDSCVEEVQTDVPITIGYLELVEGRSIADGVRRLEKQQVDEILVIPFFVCSGSTHLDEIQYALGIIEEPRKETELALIHPRAEIIWGKAMDNHPNILQVLQERIQELSENPGKESLLLVAHGSDRPYFKTLWDNTLEEMVHYFQEKLGFSEANYGTILPATITTVAQSLTKNGTKKVVAIPVFISEGYYTSKKIPTKLKGIAHIYNGSTYLPHPAITAWMQDQVNKYV
ncbi:CbiX/SirB N-terminal domain-containing protein [Evansella sp. AB-P1]|uniref:sirohydrochlorin chelatase n=1 Tax=Evansella sp. AB-P1 TaxID=3037653 RepID=UPI00241DAF81|nr:CbiX/SirB N-terminal domain-containing protein [Evansella sp. AB-P1]MDG5786190.1 CbiX/SirB N-terminal domain-containing protein [Evansella sp. AB-P1]